jgi:hypothetical protein
MKLEHDPKESRVISTEGMVIFRGQRSRAMEIYLRFSLLSREHYYRLAISLAKKKPFPKATNKMQVWREIVNEIIQTLKNENPYFNETKFRETAGLEE